MASHKALGFVALLFCACSPYRLSQPIVPTLPPFGPATAEAGTICAIRPSPWSGELTFVLKDNDQLVGATRGENYFCYRAEPGEHRLIASTGRDSDAAGTASIVVTPGSHHYLHEDFDNVWGTVIVRLRWIEPQLASEYVEKCDYKVIASVPGTETLPGDVPFARAKLDPQRAD